MGIAPCFSQPEVVFDQDLSQTVKAGHVRLSWKALEAGSLWHFQLQQDTLPDFTTARTLYEGPDLATFRSGLPDGVFYFRVRGLDPSVGAAGSWSDTLTLTVAHHSRTFALWLMGLGAVVFLLTAGLVIIGALRDQDHSSTTPIS